MTAADDLLLSGGGSIAVATDALFRMVADLRRLSGHADATALRVGCLAPAEGGTGPESAADLAEATVALRGVAQRADALALALQRSAESYGELERRAVRLARAGESLVAERTGRWLPGLLLPLLPLLSAAGAGLLLGALRDPDGAERAADGVARELLHRSGPLTHPLAVTLLRSLVLSVDDLAGGMLAAPPGVVPLLGEGGAGLVGLPGSAALLAGLAARFGAAREGRVEVRQSARRSGANPPSGFGDRADRIPTGRSQIRIERYAFAAGPDRFEVFLGGTRAADLLGGAEPWDMTSNLHAVADLSPGSRRAAEEAMRRSGITADSEVVFTGYSQGGLVAAQLAASGDWNTQGLVTFGAPAGRIELPDAFPAVHIEHTDDLVPAFGGDRTDVGPLVVRREAFDGREVPVDVPVPAHRLAEYQATGELLDAARSPTATAAAARLNAFGAGAERIEVILYRADRVADG